MSELMHNASTGDALGSALASGTSGGQSELGRGWARFKHNKLALGSLVFIGLLIVVALAAPILAPYSYAEQDLTNRFQPLFSDGHLLGTDELGRDVFSRLIYSLRTALMIGFAAELLALAIALVIGMWAAYRGGRVEQWLMAFTDVMYAFPTYLFAVLLVVIMGRSPLAIVVAIATATFVNQARLVRAQVLKIKTFEFIEASRSIGTGGVAITIRHILPNAVGPLLVATSFGIPNAIIAESGLAILGLGVAPPTPSWGGMIVDGYGYVLGNPQLIVAPLVLFGLTMLAFTWIGDGLRDAFDTSEEDRA
ncbi:ABC transporter permease [Phytoactinopolyspora halotolerans]|uniref:ABC transporter permease n=1 Tax=Phytoactinopolyspora halotolerans TaxID=1981512 RepID=A0A6L9SCE9_9ACTN|nr:ABC transporter permease [Phytoactinopolyspora halotolerans]NEE02238.1 ABC transporter permease [Phytoactinopolyspora halotolerans]